MRRSAYIIFEKKSEIPQKVFDILKKLEYNQSQLYFDEPSDEESCILYTAALSNIYGFCKLDSKFLSDDPHIGWKNFREKFDNVDEFIKHIQR